MDCCDSHHSVVDCRKVRSMPSSKCKDIVFKAKRCFICFGNHPVKDCTEWCNCRGSQTIDEGKHFSCCMIVLFLLSKSPRAAA